MSVKINLRISTKTYKQENGASFSYIFDEKEHVYYLLRGKMSDLWSVISVSDNYADIEEYAHKHNLMQELAGFLSELKQKGIIETDKFLPEPKDKYLENCIKEDNKKKLHYFEKTKNEYVENNNLLDELSLQLSYKCNLNCKHCFNPKNLNEYGIDFNSALRIIDEAYNLGITRVFITGGECTIHKDFLKIAQYIRNKHLALTFNTNALKLYDDTKFFDEIANIYPSSINISLYSMEPDVHDNITGLKGSHHKALTVIKRLRKKNINVGINCLQLSLNKDSYADVIEFSESIGAKITTNCLFINNNDNDNLSAKADFEQMVKFNEYCINNDILRKEFKKDDEYICQAGIRKINILPNFDITPCNDLKYPLGNYKEISLKKVWEEVIREFRQIFKRNCLKECFNYEYCLYCRYCPIEAVLYSGGLKKSPVLCESAKSYYTALLNCKK